MTKSETENKIKEWLDLIAEGTYKPDELYSNFKDLYSSLLHEVDQRRSQIADINQWSQLIMNNRNLNPRVVYGIVGSINNRTTD